MKKGILIILFLQTSFISFAQQRPHYTQYLQNMEVINPAFTGIGDGIIVKAGFRNQWVGLKDAPKTNYLTIHFPLNKKLSKKISDSLKTDLNLKDSLTLSIRDTTFYQTEINEIPLNNFHGLGFIALNDKTGAINRSTINLAYAYHIKLDQKMSLSFGLGGGVSRISLDYDALVFEEDNDPVTIDGFNTIWTPDINVGLYLHSNKFYFGASILQIIKETLSFRNNLNEGKQVPHFFLTSGFKIDINKEFSLTPSIMYKYVKPIPGAFDLNLKLAYRNNYWIATSYRNKDAISALIGLNINPNLNFGYAYDSNINGLKSVTSGSHELVIGYKF